MLKSLNERRVGMLEAAILVTRVEQDFETGRLWPALRDLRKGHARTLGLSGVILCDANRVMYGLEGSSQYLDRFTQMLEESPCEAAVQLLLRRPIAQRTYRAPALLAPTLAKEERTWLREELDHSASDLTTLPTFLTWLALRQAETIVGGYGHGLMGPADSFPPSRSGVTRH